MLLVIMFLVDLKKIHIHTICFVRLTLSSYPQRQIVVFAVRKASPTNGSKLILHGVLLISPCVN